MPADLKPSSAGPLAACDDHQMGQLITAIAGAAVATVTAFSLTLIAKWSRSIDRRLDAIEVSQRQHKRQHKQLQARRRRRR